MLKFNYSQTSLLCAEYYKRVLLIAEKKTTQHPYSNQIFLLLLRSSRKFLLDMWRVSLHKQGNSYKVKMFLVVGETLSFRMRKTSTTHTKWLPKHQKLSPNKYISTEFWVKLPAYHRSTVNNFTYCPVRLPTMVGLFQLVGHFQSFKFVNTFHVSITMILIHIITIMDVLSTCTV